MIPNFLIIGAARAGTTSIRSRLMQHPEIFMSGNKELRYFATEEEKPKFRGPGDNKLNENWITSWDEYCEAFSSVTHQTAVGEASPFYLCSECAPRRIRENLPHTKLIVILREPSSRAFSSFQYLRMMGRELIADFRDALDAEEGRIKDNWEYMWRYKSLGLYGEQIQRYLDHFPREQLFVGIFDDFVKNPVLFLQRIFEFLNVDPYFRPPTVDRLNLSGNPVSASLYKFFSNDALTVIGRTITPKQSRPYIRRFLTRNSIKAQKISIEEREELNIFFRPGIEKLETLIQKDLSEWKT